MGLIWNIKNNNLYRISKRLKLYLKNRYLRVNKVTRLNNTILLDNIVLYRIVTILVDIILD